MKILSVDDVHDWLRTSSLLDAQERVDLGSALGPKRVWIPKETGSKTNLAKTLSETFRSANDGLLWINEFGIWPSSEYRLIFDALRQSFNESRPLQAAPGHVFSAADMDILGAMLAVALYFSWGALLLRGGIELIDRISHDDFVDFYGRTKALSIVGKLLVAQKYVSDEGWS